MSKHTPGPWKFAPHMKDHRIFTVEKTKYHRTKTICDLYDNPQRPQEFKANAHLIAAAPELLEAIIKAHDILLALHVCSKLADDTRALLKQAIAKAEGVTK